MNMAATPTYSTSKLNINSNKILKKMSWKTEDIVEVTI